MQHIFAGIGIGDADRQALPHRAAAFSQARSAKQPGQYRQSGLAEYRQQQIRGA